LFRKSFSVKRIIYKACIKKKKKKKKKEEEEEEERNTEKTLKDTILTT
jgi:hypothetical protein